MTEQMNITNVIRRLLKQWMIIVLAGVIVALTGGIVASRIYKPQYEAQAIIVVYDKNAGSGIRQAEETVSIFKEIITSNLLQKKIAEELEIEALPGTIACEEITNTNMITMKAFADTPQDAMTVMNGVLDHYDEAAGSLLQNTVLRVLEEPCVPTEATSAYNEMDVLSKLFLGTVAMLLAVGALVMHFRDDIKYESQVEQKLDTKLFSVIYHENKMKRFSLKKRKEKVGLLITNPVTSFGYAETIRKMSLKAQYLMKHMEGKVLLVTSVQENEGKSTIAANLALSMAKSGKKVILIDGDLRKPAQFKLFGQTYGKEDAQFATLISGETSLKDSIRKTDVPGLYLLAGNRSYKNAVKLLLGESAQKFYANMAQNVDYVVIDTPPLYQAADAEELMRFADAGLLVVRQNYSKVRDINDAIDSFRNTKCQLLGCVLNDVETGILGNAITGTDEYSNKYGYGNYSKKELKDEQ